MKKQQLQVGLSLINAENVETIFNAYKTPLEFDLLSIDIDYNDYWVWKAITKFTPRVVVIEYNAAFGPSIEWKINYDPAGQWDGTRNFGASLKSLELLGREKGYALVGCNLTGANAFFVRQDLLGDHFLEPFTSERHYQRSRYYLKFSDGHARSIREMEHFL